MPEKTQCPLFVAAQMINGERYHNEGNTVCRGAACEWFVRIAYTDDQQTTSGCSIRLNATKNTEGLQVS